jgi:hypothetical protein
VINGSAGYPGRQRRTLTRDPAFGGFRSDQALPGHAVMDEWRAGELGRGCNESVLGARGEPKRVSNKQGALGQDGALADPAP